MSLDRFSRRFLDYEELMQQEHPIYKVRRYMATALYAEEQSGDRLLLDHVAWSSALIGRLFWCIVYVSCFILILFVQYVLEARSRSD